MTISLLVNRQRRTVPASPDTPLLYVLRNDLALNGVRFGCGQAQCGACTVMLGKTPVRSCVFPVGAVRGQAVTTVEGLGTSGQLHPLQQAFIDEQAAQCGYCSSGMLMAAKALLDATPHPDEQAVRSTLAGQKCRCGAHSRIVRAVLRAAEAMRA